MTYDELVDRIATAIATYEGFFSRGPRPTLAQRNANPGNIRFWRNAAGVPYPRSSGFVDFVAWARGDREAAVAEGWRVLRVQIQRYLRNNPSYYEMFSRWAPVSDGNNPNRYAAFVASRVGATPEDKILSILTEEAVNDRRV